MEDWTLLLDEHSLLIIGAIIFVWLGYRIFIFCYDHNLLEKDQTPPGYGVLHGAGVGFILIAIGCVSLISAIFSGNSSIQAASVEQAICNSPPLIWGNIPSAPQWPPQTGTVSYSELGPNIDIPVWQNGPAIEVTPIEQHLEDNDEIDFLIARELFTKGRLEEAADMFATIAQNSPSVAYRVKAYFYRGECFFSTGQTDLALLQYQEAINLSSDQEWRARAMYQQAEVFLQIGKGTISHHLYSQLASRYPATIEGRIASLQLNQTSIL